MPNLILIEERAFQDANFVIEGSLENLTVIQNQAFEVRQEQPKPMQVFAPDDIGSLVMIGERAFSSDGVARATGSRVALGGRS